MGNNASGSSGKGARSSGTSKSSARTRTRTTAVVSQGQKGGMQQHSQNHSTKTLESRLENIENLIRLFFSPKGHQFHHGGFAAPQGGWAGSSDMLTCSICRSNVGWELVDRHSHSCHSSKRLRDFEVNGGRVPVVTVKCQAKLEIAELEDTGPSEWMCTRNLGRYDIKSLGVSTLDDLKLVDESDLVDIGMASRVERARFWRALSEQFPGQAIASMPQKPSQLPVGIAKFLERNKLRRYSEQVVGLGARRLAELMEITEFDLVSTDMTPVERKRFLRKAARAEPEAGENNGPAPVLRRRSVGPALRDIKNSPAGIKAAAMKQAKRLREQRRTSAPPSIATLQIESMLL